jgi:hypothetical protein
VGTLLAAALVDGSANALLALRVGIVTRNMLSPVLPGCPARQNPYRESAALLGRMTAGLVRAVVKAAMGGMASGIRSGLEGTAREDVPQALAEGSADVVRKGARATAHGVGGVVHLAGDVATSVARAMPFRADAPLDAPPDATLLDTPLDDHGEGGEAATSRTGSPPHARAANSRPRPPDEPPPAPPTAPPTAPEDTPKPSRLGRIPNPLRLFRKKQS